MTSLHAAGPMLVKLAGLLVEVHCSDGYAKRALAPYVAQADGRRSFAVHMASADVERERAFAPAFPEGQLEFAAVHRAVGERMPEFDRIVFHGCAVEYGGRAYLFAAPSGTGKSTHARLWVEYLAPHASILNGDKPFVHVPSMGEPMVYGSPWTGKEGWGRNTAAPLAGICLLHQALECSIQRVEPGRLVGRIVRQCYIPRLSSAMAARALGLVDRLLARVPVFELGCDVSEQAVMTSFNATTGLEYPHRVRMGK